MVVVLASSSDADGGIGCWDLHTGSEQIRYKSFSSPCHGLVSVGDRFLASSQLRDTATSAGSVFFWSWSKPQVEVKSFPAEPITPLAANHSGMYLVGGGLSGEIYLWEVETGRLLKKWHGHNTAVTCLVFSEDDSLLISGFKNGTVRVWSLLMIFDDVRRREASKIYEYSFSDHTLCVNDVVIGYGGCNAIIASASDDRTCKTGGSIRLEGVLRNADLILWHKVWTLSNGMLQRNIVFPSKIKAIALDPTEHVLYAGSEDGKIFIVALNTTRVTTNNQVSYITGSFSNHSKAVTCLAYSAAENFLISGSDDGMVRVWNASTHNIIRVFKHAKGPITNILVLRQENDSSNHLSFNLQAAPKKKGAQFPPLEKYANSIYDDSDKKTIVSLGGSNTCMDVSYLSSHVISSYSKELKSQGSTAASELEIEKLKRDCQKSMQMVNKWKTMYENLHQFCVKEMLDENGK